MVDCYLTILVNQICRLFSTTHTPDSIITLGELIGIDKELNKFYKSDDKFLLHFKNMLKERIGEEYYPYIDYKLVKVKGNTVFLVDCNESRSPCYLDRLEFYVRNNPSTDKLEGPKLVEYVKNHFNQ